MYVSSRKELGYLLTEEVMHWSCQRMCWAPFWVVWRQGDQNGQIYSIGRLFSLVWFKKKYWGCAKSLATFFHDTSFVIILTKTGFTTLYFFTNLSGHPVWRVPGIIFTKMSGHTATMRCLRRNLPITPLALSLEVKLKGWWRVKIIEKTSLLLQN
jgi:hypothetical protein